MLAALALFAAVWLGRHRVGRGPLAGLAFFAITLSPVLGFVDYGYMQFALVADRFQYLAGIGVMAVVTGAAVCGWKRLPGPAKTGAAIGGVGVLVFFSVLTFRQSTKFESQITLFEHIVSLNPHARDGYLNLTQGLLAQGRYEDALVAAHHSLETSADPASAYSNLGAALLNLERYDEAEEHLRRARETSPNHLRAAQNLAALAARRGDLERAAALYREVLAIDSSHVAAYAGLGTALFDMERYEPAVPALRRAVALTMETATVVGLRNRIAQALERLGLRDEYLLLLELEPENPAFLARLANVRSLQGRHEEASGFLRRAREMEPESVTVLQNTAEALRRQGRYVEAVEGSAGNGAGSGFRIRIRRPCERVVRVGAIRGCDRSDGTVHRTRTGAECPSGARGADRTRAC